MFLGQAKVLSVIRGLFCGAWGALPGKGGCEVWAHLRHPSEASGAAFGVSCGANVQDLTPQLSSRHWPIKTSDDLFMSCQPKLSLKPAGKDLIFIIIRALHTLLPVDTTHLHTCTQRGKLEYTATATEELCPWGFIRPLARKCTEFIQGSGLALTSCLRSPMCGVPAWLEASGD